MSRNGKVKIIGVQFLPVRAATEDERAIWAQARRARSQVELLLNLIADRCAPVGDDALDVLERAVEALSEQVIDVQLDGTGA